MKRQQRAWISYGLCLVSLMPGCQPVQPFFFGDDGDLSHYVDVATKIEFADVAAAPLAEVELARAPLTLANAEDYEWWDLTLEEATRYALANSQVMRQLGGRIADGGLNIAGTTPEILTQTGGSNATTTYDPAIVESGNGTGSGGQLGGVGVEAALSEFDATLDSRMFWQSNDRPQNFRLQGLPDFFAPNFRQELGNYSLGVTKAAADGSQFEIRNNVNYDQNNNGSRQTPSDWTTNFEVGFTRPFLQGAGTQYNRIAGVQSFQQANAGFVNSIDGVMIARIRHDVSLADFEAGVHGLMRDVEDAYWELYFAYRDLGARKIGRDSSLETWRRIKALQRAGQAGGEANQEAQARSQYYLFRSQVETALTSLFRIENRLRYVMGLSVSDGRLIRPVDEPSAAQVFFDWGASHSEAQQRRVEVRRKKWEVKRRELELIAARNHLLPRLDAVGRYRWLGAGDELIDSSGVGARPFQPGSNAFDVLTSGDYQEWELGLQFSLPIGFRRAMSGVRHHQLLLARERALLQDVELEVSHQLGDAIRDVDLNYGVTQTNFNRRAAAEDEVEAVQAVYDVGRVTLDLLLDAQRRRAEAESSYYRSLVDYNRAIMRVHHRKGSLLEFNGVYLAEGPWPGKAYFDALRRARGRDASLPLRYGFTRPQVVSGGPVEQFRETPAKLSAPAPTPVRPEEIPLPDGGEGEETLPPRTPRGDAADLGPAAGAFASGVRSVQYAEPLPEVERLPAIEVARE